MVDDHVSEVMDVLICWSRFAHSLDFWSSEEVVGDGGGFVGCVCVGGGDGGGGICEDDAGLVDAVGRGGYFRREKRAPIIVAAGASSAPEIALKWGYVGKVIGAVMESILFGGTSRQILELFATYRASDS